MTGINRLIPSRAHNFAVTEQRKTRRVFHISWLARGREAWREGLTDAEKPGGAFRASGFHGFYARLRSARSSPSWVRTMASSTASKKGGNSAGVIREARRPKTGGARQVPT